MALQDRPLRDFEKQAHLHLLDWAHETAKHQLHAAGLTQVKAAAKQIARHGPATPPRLPALEAAMTGELRKLYALGHATVRSELDHQRRHTRTVPVGLSAAPAPPHLRKAKPRKGPQRACATCKMFDHGVCWGYGNYAVKPNQVCDSWAADSTPKQLAEPPEGPGMMGDETAGDPASLKARGRLIAEAVGHAVHQAVVHGRLRGIRSRRRLRQLGEEAGEGALRAQASQHAGGAIGAGRTAAANLQGGEIIGARYTSVLDKNTCGPCRQADDGVLRALTDPLLQPAPNPECEGGPRCRCIWVYQLKGEGGQHGEFSTDELRMIKRAGGSRHPLPPAGG